MTPKSPKPTTSVAVRAAFAMKPVIVLLLLLGLTSTGLGYDAIVSPKCTLHILDQDGKPVPGLKVERAWDGSDGKKGQDEVTTDSSGMVAFEKVTITRSVIKRVFKPLLIFVPASCGPEWETYSSTKITVNWPGEYSLKSVPAGFKSDGSAFSDQGGTHINCSRPVAYFLSHAAPELGQLKLYQRISFSTGKKIKILI